MSGENSAYARQLQSALAQTGVTGASFAYWDGERLHTATAGLRNSVAGDPVTVDTAMQVGSITKVMNAALVMQLVDEGKITLGDRITDHLPELRLRDVDALRQITCGMLLNHTSGINCDWLPEYGPDQERIVDSIERCAGLTQLHPPGAATSYCNMGTVIAGYLAQKLQGKSWYTLIKERLYEPLGMAHSLVDPLEVPRFRCSIGDVTDHRTGRMSQTPRPMLAPSFAPAGATQMNTATDVVTFARALLSDGVGPNGSRILSAASAARMREPSAQFYAPVGWKMGLGWMITSEGFLNHDGSGRGVNSMLYADPERGRAVALLTNCDRGISLKPFVLDPILESWAGGAAPGRPPQKTPSDVEPYVGTYENNLHRARVLARDGHLLLQQGTTGEQMGELFDFEIALTARLNPLGEDLFEAEYVTPGVPHRMEVRFVLPDADGRMTFFAGGYHLLARVQ
jgi:CubicO group peptidase (beta-lactamase class C family)